MRHMVTALACAAAVVVLAGCICEDFGAGSPAARPGGPPKLAIRVNCGAAVDYVDQKGVAWSADRLLQGDAQWGAVGGLTVERTGLALEGTPRPALYVTERYEMDGYQFAVPAGTYTIRLHFAETYDGITAAGQRVFSVKINGQGVLGDLDVLKESGGQAKPLIKEITGLKVADGKIKIEFVTNVQKPEINAIEVLGQ
jgi:endoglucanase